jgi:3-oxoacyl-[acyl-carrier-protein] synthase II
MANSSANRRVVLTGLGVVSPVGNDVNAFWNNLLAGECGVDRITAFDASAFDSQVAAEVKDFNPTPAFPSPKEVRRTDRFAQFGVHAAWEALNDCGADLAKVNLDRVGSIIGSGIGGLSTTTAQHQVLLERGPGRLSPFMIPMLIGNMVSGQVSMYWNLRGPNYATCSACATGNHAIGEAWRAIRMDDADMMVAGGAEATVVPVGIGGFCAMKALSTRNDDPKTASRPFDEGRDGFVMGEGAGIVILEELEHAKARGARIYCELVGYGNTADAHHLTAPSPGGEGAARCMNMALRGAGMGPADIQYVNAHGTSTPQGDIAEIMALKAVFGDHAKSLVVSSTKGATGHMLGAAGAAELVVCAKAIEAGKVPPTINIQSQDPQCDLDCVANEAREFNVDAAINNSFGFGGHNATTLVRRFVD